MVKKYCVVVLLFILSCGLCTQIKDGNIITELIEEFIEKRRPEVAKLKIPFIDLKEKGSVSNLTILNLESFVIERMESYGPFSINLKNFTVSLDMASATGTVYLSDAAIPDIDLNMNGTGTVQTAATQLRLTAEVDIRLHLLTPYIKNWSNLDIWVGSLNANLTGFDNLTNVTDIVNTKLANWLTEHLSAIADQNKETIIPAINKVIDGSTFKEKFLYNILY